MQCIYTIISTGAIQAKFNVSLLSITDVDWQVGASHNRGMAAGLPQRVKGMHQLENSRQKEATEIHTSILVYNDR